MKTKGGLCAWFVLERNLQSSSALDQADVKNKAYIQLLYGETRQWGRTEYINAQKKHHQTQTDIHGDHEYPDFTTHEKVLFLTGGSNTSVYDLPLLQIECNETGACSNFKLASFVTMQWRFTEYINAQKKHHQT